jgi:hypothetical protein
MVTKFIKFHLKFKKKNSLFQPDAQKRDDIGPTCSTIIISLAEFANINSKATRKKKLFTKIILILRFHKQPTKKKKSANFKLNFQLFISHDLDHDDAYNIKLVFIFLLPLLSSFLPVKINQQVCMKILFVYKIHKQQKKEFIVPLPKNKNYVKHVQNRI